VEIAVQIIFALGLLALAVSVALFALFRFERFMGVRYLRRGQISNRVRVGLWGSLAVTGVGLVVFLLTRGRVQSLATLGVVWTLNGVLATIVFLLLRTFSVFTTVSTMGVVLGVASLVVVLAVTSGFEREFQEKVLAVNAHLIVTAYGIDRPLSESEQEADEVLKKLRTLPGVVRMSKFSFSAGEVMVGRVGANLKGIDLDDGAPELRHAVVAGSVDDLKRPASCPDGDTTTPGRMFVGTELARRARVKLGDCVPLLVPFASEGAGTPAPFRFKIVGIFQMGFNEYDSRLAFVNLDDARRLANARQSVFGVELRFRDPMLALSSQEEVERRLGPEPRILDWKTLNHNLFMALTMQKLIIALVLAIIILVAAVNILSSLTLIVLSKVREIAILNSMGARRWSLRNIFMVGGSFVGFAGSALGILYGLAVCWLAQLYGYPLDPKVYLIARLPVEISIREILFVAATTQLICVLVTIYPAERAARLKVVEGLRYL
jgi:lipoprotein-releasing system permease protein